MDRARFSQIAHADHRLLSPLCDSSLAQITQALKLPRWPRILDVGCGTGTYLIDLVARTGGHGIGIDRDPVFLERARGAALAAGLTDSRIRWLEQDASQYTGEDPPFQLALCLGATGIYGGFEGTLHLLRDFVVPGGLILIGEGYWRRDPADEYLAILGASREEMTSHADTIERGIASGLTYLYSLTSAESEWDHYEGLYNAGIERYCATHPEDADTPAFRARIRAWREAYHRYGRDTLGFGVYLFRT